MTPAAYLARELRNLRAKHPQATTLLGLNRRDAKAVAVLDACRRSVGLSPITQADFQAARTGKPIRVFNRQLF